MRVIFGREGGGSDDGGGGLSRLSLFEEEEALEEDKVIVIPVRWPLFTEGGGGGGEQEACLESLEAEKRGGKGCGEEGRWSSAHCAAQILAVPGPCTSREPKKRSNY